MNVFDDAGARFWPRRPSSTFTDVRSRKTEGFTQALPGRQAAHVHGCVDDERSRRAAREMREIELEHREESGPALLETFYLVIPVVGHGKERVHHAHDALSTRASSNGDFGGDGRRSRLPVALHVAKAVG